MYYEHWTDKQKYFYVEIEISQERNELLRLNKKHFSSNLKDVQLAVFAYLSKTWECAFNILKHILALSVTIKLLFYIKNKSDNNVILEINLSS